MRVDIWDTVTDVYWWNKATREPIVVNQGGTYSGKTISILQVLIDRAIEEPGARVTVTATDFPKLYDDPLKEFKKLISKPTVSPFFIDHTLDRGPYKLKNGSEFTFRCFQNFEDAKGAKRQYLYACEATGIPWDVFDELMTRTEKQTFIDYNPTARFWAHDKLNHRDDCQLIISTFLDNPYCEDKKRNEILGWFQDYLANGNEDALNKWRVYGQGKTGTVSGMVIPNYKIINKFPDPYFLRSTPDGLTHVYGMDFGYTTDPTTVIKLGVRSENNRLATHQLFYETGFNSFDLPELFPELGIVKGKDIVIADSANLEAIDLLARHGYRMVAAKKDPGSVKAGIELINKHGLDVTQSSDEYLDELKRYKYKKQNGIFNKDMPIDAFNHCIDPTRYAATYFLYGWGEMRGKVKKIQKPRRAYAY